MSALWVRRASLLITALLAGLIWRGELEWHGWYSVAWVGWFHWAVPAGALLFAAWLAVFGGARRPIALALTSMMPAAASYEVLHRSLMVIYSRWPLPVEEIRWAIALGLSSIVLYPLLLWVAGRCCGAAIRWAPCAIAAGLWAGAVPLAIVILDVIDHVGGADFLHAIKSGVVIPILLVALGLPFVGPEAQGVAGGKGAPSS